MVEFFDVSPRNDRASPNVETLSRAASMERCVTMLRVTGRPEAQ